MDQSRNQDLQAYLGSHSVEWLPLSTSHGWDAEHRWRGLYAAYLHENCGHYLIVPISSQVVGLPISPHGRHLDAYECRGPLVSLGNFCDAEFFVEPLDLSWTMIPTHEDHALGGPYFIRSEWLRGSIPL